MKLLSSTIQYRHLYEYENQKEMHHHMLEMENEGYTAITEPKVPAFMKSPYMIEYVRNDYLR